MVHNTSNFTCDLIKTWHPFFFLNPESTAFAANWSYRGGGQLPSQVPNQLDVAYLPDQESAVEAPFRTLIHQLSLYLLYPLLLLAVPGPARVQPGCGRTWGRTREETLLEAKPWVCSVQGPFSSASVCLGKGRGSVSCIINEGGWRPA